jgi:hypothetical protein
VADTNNHRIRVIDLSDDGTTASSVSTLEITGLTPPAMPQAQNSTGAN